MNNKIKIVVLCLAALTVSYFGYDRSAKSAVSLGEPQVYMEVVTLKMKNTILKDYGLTNDNASGHFQVLEPSANIIQNFGDSPDVKVLNTPSILTLNKEWVRVVAGDGKTSGLELKLKPEVTDQNNLNLNVESLIYQEDALSQKIKFTPDPVDVKPSEALYLSASLDGTSKNESIVIFLTSHIIHSRADYDRILKSKIAQRVAVRAMNHIF